MKHLHLEIKLDFKRNFVNYIDDVIIYVNGKNVKENCKLLIKIAKFLFDWIEKNHVIFDNDKSELIHFEKSRKGSNDKMILPNGKILTPQVEVKYLGFWLDRKLNFKKHCQTRVTNAKKALYAMMSLLNFERNLLLNAVRQLYFTCIVSIADYESKIYFNSMIKNKNIF